MRIFDCFTFYNELDLLEFRLKLLYEKVDFFVIVEADKTFSGKPKPYVFLENKERFDQWGDKIIYIQAELNTTGMDLSYVPKGYESNSPYFQLETQQRNALSTINELLEDDDMVMIGDLDEIPSYEFLNEAKYAVRIIGSSLSIQNFHYYYMNCMQLSWDSKWKGTLAIHAKTFKQLTPQSLRNDRANFIRQYDYIGGWHFSYLGGIEAIRKKIDSFAHQEYNNDSVKSDENIIRSLNEGKDVFDRPGISHKVVPLSEYPEYLQKIMIQYPQFLKESK